VRALLVSASLFLISGATALAAKPTPPCSPFSEADILDILSDVLGTPKLPAAWKVFSEKAELALEHHFTSNRNLYLAKKNMGDPHVLALEKHFGFRFTEKEIYIPPIDEIFKRFNAKMDGHVANGVIHKSERLRFAQVYAKRVKVTYAKLSEKISTSSAAYSTNDPAHPDYERLFKEWSSIPGNVDREVFHKDYMIVETPEQLVYVEPGQTPPVGSKLWPYLLGDVEFLKMVESGYYPLGGLDDYNLPGGEKFKFSAFVHDLSHMTGALDHPQSFAALARAPKQFKGKIPSKISIEVANTFVGPGATFRKRIFFGAELVFKVNPPPSGIDWQLLVDFPLSKKTTDSVLTVAEVNNEILLRYPTRLKLAERSKDIVDTALQMVEGIGGAGRDVITHESSPTFNAHISLMGQINYVKQLAATPNISPLDLAHELARLEVLLFEMSKVPPHQLADEALKEKVSRSSKLYKIFCLTGALDQYLDFKRAFCIDTAP